MSKNVKSVKASKSDKGGAATAAPPKKKAKAEILRRVDGGANALGSRGERTLKIDAVLIAAAKKGEWLKPKQIADRCPGVKAISPHLHTLYVQNVLERGPLGYRLSPMALTLCKKSK